MIVGGEDLRLHLEPASPWSFDFRAILQRRGRGAASVGAGGDVGRGRISGNAVTQRDLIGHVRPREEVVQMRIVDEERAHR